MEKLRLERADRTPSRRSRNPRLHPRRRGIPRPGGAPEPEEEPEPELRKTDLFVEVGDLVTYCDLSNPDAKKSVTIVTGKTDLEAGLLNENTPLARVLLGLEPGDCEKLSIPGKLDRELRVLKIQRKNSAGNGR